MRVCEPRARRITPTTVCDAHDGARMAATIPSSRTPTVQMLLVAGCCAQQSSDTHRKNVLLLICDDLRTQLKSYGHADYMHTPNIDKLAADALVFDRAYTNYPYCAPSRNSFMSGRMPAKTKAWNFIDQ